jgi:hypothetical protein
VLRDEVEHDAAAKLGGVAVRQDVAFDQILDQWLDEAPPVDLGAADAVLSGKLAA